MKKTLSIIGIIKTILTVLFYLSLIMVVCVDGNDDVTIILAIVSISLFVLYLFSALVEDLVQNQIARNITAVERSLAEKRIRHEETKRRFDRRA